MDEVSIYGLDGTMEEQNAALRKFLGLREDQPFSEIEVEDDEDGEDTGDAEDAEGTESARDDDTEGKQ
jgi:hypothetical protein